MGFTTVPDCSLDLEMPQLPRNIYRVRVLAGWTYAEAAKELEIDPEVFKQAEQGFKQLPDSVWREFIDRAGRRAFDAEEI